MPRKAIIGGNEYYFRQDVLGNVTAITDANGDIVETYEYDVFGKPTVRDALGNVLAKPMTPFLMTGHYYDADVGIYITRYRAYSPELGRWLTRDPIDFSGGDRNLYRYVGNNPSNGKDLLGLWNLFNPFTWGISNLPGQNSWNPFDSSAMWSETGDSLCEALDGRAFNGAMQIGGSFGAGVSGYYLTMAGHPAGPTLLTASAPMFGLGVTNVVGSIAYGNDSPLAAGTPTVLDTIIAVVDVLLSHFD